MIVKTIVFQTKALLIEQNLLELKLLQLIMQV
jgi:hypothetical protein